MSEYDDLIERGISELATVILHSTPEAEARLMQTLMQATRLRSGRPIDDGLVDRGVKTRRSDYGPAGFFDVSAASFLSASKVPSCALC